MLTFEGEKYFIKVPFVTRLRTSATELIGILLTKLAAPFTDGFIGHHHAAFEQELFDITKAQAKPKVQPDGVADDFHGEPVVFIFRGGRQCLHAATLPHSVRLRQVDNAPCSATAARDRHSDGRWRGYCPVPPSPHSHRWDGGRNGSRCPPRGGVPVQRPCVVADNRAVGELALRIACRRHSGACG